MNKNKLVIFDCFGVIFDEVAVRFFNKHFAPDKAAELKDKYFIPADLGEIEYDEIFERMSAELGWDKDELLRDWNSYFRLREEMIPVIKGASERADVVLLSNAPKGVVERLFSENSLEGLFMNMTISANVKMAKPSPEIYLYCVKSTGKKYDEIFMIDDSEANLRHLPGLGITPILFEGVSNLEEKLAKLL